MLSRTFRSRWQNTRLMLNQFYEASGLHFHEVMYTQSCCCIYWSWLPPRVEAHVKDAQGKQLSLMLLPLPNNDSISFLQTCQSLRFECFSVYPPCFCHMSYKKKKKMKTNIYSLIFSLLDQWTLVDLLSVLVHEDCVISCVELAFPASQPASLPTSTLSVGLVCRKKLSLAYCSATFLYTCNSFGHCWPLSFYIILSSLDLTWGLQGQQTAKFDLIWIWYAFGRRF